VFVKSYLLKRGFLDGAPGFMVAAMGAVSVFFKYSKLYEIQLGKDNGAESWNSGYSTTQKLKNSKKPVL